MKTSLNQDRLDSCSSISHMFSSDNEEQTESNESIDNYDTSTCTPAPIARVSFTPALGITSTSTPTVLATDMFSDISDNEEETESNKTIDGALKVREGN